MIGPLLLAILLAPPPTGPEVEAKVVKAIKEAERAGFERHRAAAYFSLFTRDAVWVRGRRETPDAHDVTLSRAQMEALVKLELAPPPSREERLYFEEVKPDWTTDPPVVVAKIDRHFFGGEDSLAVRYTLRFEKGAWKAAAARIWPLKEHVAHVNVTYNDKFWTKADEMANRPGTLTLEDQMENLRWARRFRQAYDLSVQLTSTPGVTAASWILRAEAALRVGLLEDARAAVKQAWALDPLVVAPPLLRGIK